MSDQSVKTNARRPWTVMDVAEELGINLSVREQSKISAAVDRRWKRLHGKPPMKLLILQVIENESHFVRLYGPEFRDVIERAILAAPSVRKALAETGGCRPTKAIVAPG